MPCPFFFPIGALDEKERRAPQRVPLGEPHSGVCHADPVSTFTPDAATLRELCQFGYARDRCGRFPRECAADAYRYSVTGEAAGFLEIRYVIERDHHPAGFGSVQFSLGDDRLASPHPDSVLQRQLEMYARSWWRRRLASEVVEENLRALREAASARRGAPSVIPAVEEPA